METNCTLKQDKKAGLRESSALPLPWLQETFHGRFLVFMACPSADLETSRRGKEKTFDTQGTFPFYSTIKRDKIQCAVVTNNEK